MGEKMVKKKNVKKVSVRQKMHKGVDRVMDETGNIEKSGREAVSRLNKKAKSVRSNVKKSVTRLRKKAESKRKNVSSYIRKNPEKSVSIAAGIGAVFGAIVALIMGRKR